MKRLFVNDTTTKTCVYILGCIALVAPDLAKAIATQKTKTVESILIGHRSNAKWSDGCPIDVDICYLGMITPHGSGNPLRANFIIFINITFNPVALLECERHLSFRTEWISFLHYCYYKMKNGLMPMYMIISWPGHFSALVTLCEVIHIGHRWILLTTDKWFRAAWTIEQRVQWRLIYDAHVMSLYWKR